MELEPSYWSGPRGRMAYSVSGAGPVVVLLHPIGVDRFWWSAYERALRSSHTVIAIDMLGHGQSDMLRSPITLHDHALDVLGILDHERTGPVALVGVSMGGMVAQYAACENPRATTALIACATAATFPNEVRAAIRSRGDASRSGDMSEVVDGTLQRWFSDTAPPSLVERCKAQLLAGDWYSWSANWEAISQLDTVALLSGANVPTLAVSAGADASLPQAVTRKIADAARGEFIVVENASHFGPFEKPSQFLPVFQSFLDQHSTNTKERA